MKNRIVLILSAAVLTFHLSSCSDKQNPIGISDAEAVLVGKVINSGGNPVEGVGVHIIPYQKFIAVPGSLSDKPLPSTQIRYSIPYPSRVTLVILRNPTRDTIAYLLRDSLLAAGAYSVQYTWPELTNGIYVYVLKWGNNVSENKMLIIKDSSELINAVPLATTDENGNFTLTYKQLCIGEVFNRTAEGDHGDIWTVISDSTQVFLVKTSYTHSPEWVKIDTMKTTRATFRIR